MMTIAARPSGRLAMFEFECLEKLPWDDHYTICRDADYITAMCMIGLYFIQNGICTLVLRCYSSKLNCWVGIRL